MSSLQACARCIGLALVVMALAGVRAPVHAADLAMATIVEGQATVLRGTQRLLLAPGAGMLPDDIVETGPAGFVQVEAAGGVFLGIGPATRLLFDAGRGGPPVPYLLAGWVKYAVGTGKGSIAPSMRLPRIELGSVSGTVVVQASARETRLFSESGALQVVEVREGGRVPSPLKAGQFWSAGPDGRGRAAARPDGAFMGAMPAAFRDTLPSLLERVATRKPALKPAPAPAYAELEAWITLDDAPLRGRFAQRFAPRLQDPAFRQSVQANLSRHPEWQPVLLPFKNP